MHRPRFSIAALMAIVALLGLIFAGLRASRPLGASALYTAILAVLLAAIPGAVACGGRGRTTWLGLGVFGWTYLFVGFSPWAWLNNEGLRPPPLFGTALVRYLGESDASWLDNQYESVSWVPVAFHDPASLSIQRLMSPHMRISVSPLKQAVHLIGAVVFAAIGALVGRMLGRREDAPAS